MIDTSNNPMQKAETSSSRTSGIANIFVGLMIGGGTAAYIQEFRIAEANQRNSTLIIRANETVKEAYPIVTAAALEADMPLPPGAHFPQGIPDRFYDLRTVVQTHSEAFGKAVEALHSEAQKR